MSKTSTITTRIEPELKRNAETVLQRLGVNTTDAITMFLSQVVLHRGLPFDVRLPNAVTRAAIAELDSGRGERFKTATGVAIRQIMGKPKKPAK